VDAEARALKGAFALADLESRLLLLDATVVVKSSQKLAEKNNEHGDCKATKRDEPHALQAVRPLARWGLP
jgi:hypothetical protein